MTDDPSANPFGHIHKALDNMNSPSEDLSKLDTLGWGYSKDKLDPEVDGKPGDSEGLDQERLETMTFLTEAERLDLSIEKVIARSSLDLPALAFTESLARSSIAVKGRGRLSVEKMLVGTGQKISVPTTLQKIKRTLVGGKQTTEEQTLGTGDED